MKNARLLVLVIALAAGAIAAFLVSRSRQPPRQSAAGPAIATVDVLTARTDLARGQMIQPSDIGWQMWPVASANKNFITKAARPDAARHFVGAIVRVSVAAGEPIYDPQVVFAKGSGFMAAILPKGMRAVAMDIAADSSAGGFVLPDDHVDVVLTHHDKAAEKQTGIDRLVADTILRNVPVLAVDQAVEHKSGKKFAVGRTVTLEVTPPQAETLAAARQQGTLSLALRSLADSQSSIPLGGDGHHNRGNAISTVRFGVSALAATAR
jgi:pilus assembly protein CpaB